MMDNFLLNPAVAGSEGYSAFNITSRKNWLGYNGGPLTNSLTAQTRVTRSSNRPSTRFRRKSSSGKVGLGGYIFNDKNGAINRTGFQLTYAYHIRIKNAQLSLGVSGSGFQFRINKDDLSFKSQNDPLDNGADKVMFIPDANVGVYYSSENLYVGLAVNQLFQSALKFNDNGSEYKMLRNYYLSGGYKIAVSKDFQVEPSILFQTTEKLLSSFDFNVKGIYREDYWFGISYRTSGAIVTMTGVKVKMFNIGYAFDYSFGEIQKISYGSHELMIGVKFGDDQRRYKYLNRF